MHILVRYLRLLLTITVLGLLGLYAVLSLSKTGPWAQGGTKKRTLFFKKQPEMRIITKLRRHEMSGKEKAIAMDLLNTFTKIAKHGGFEYFLYSGTLLGSWRHHAMIPWDDDVDIILNVTCQSRLLKILTKLQPRYFVYDTSGIRFKLWSRDSTFKTQYPWKWPYLDIQFYNSNATHLWDVGPEFEDVKYPLNLVFPLHERPFEGQMFPAPRDTLSMLRINYQETHSMCVTWFYSHKLEDSVQETVEVPCHTLKDYFPFVHRRIVNGKMQETLKLREKIIQVKTIEEPLTSVSEAYSLTRLGPPGNG